MNMVYISSLLVLLGLVPMGMGQGDPSNARKPADEKDLAGWLENMVVDHGFSVAEVRAATGLSELEINTAIKRLNLETASRPKRAAKAKLRILPYPGGRHPRIGFLEGAVRPQRETKISVFTPWDPKSYVVADIPEAIWWNGPERELLYLAHEHVPTHWTKKSVDLEPLEWKPEKDGSYTMHRTLPNRIGFGTRVRAHPDWVEMEQWITNGTDRMLTGLRVQNCVMLKGAAGFEKQTVENKIFNKPYAACRDVEGRRWVISAWTHCVRPWGNASCPCLHSDPQFPDCPPGKTVRLKGWLSFYVGEDIKAELKRIETLDWRKKAKGSRPRL